MEERIAAQKRLPISEPRCTEQAYFDGQDCLESYAETSWRDSISYLQLASRFLYSTERSGTEIGRAARHAPHKPRNEASLPVGNGRAGKAGRGEKRRAAVGKE